MTRERTTSLAPVSHEAWHARGRSERPLMVTSRPSVPGMPIMRISRTGREHQLCASGSRAPGGFAGATLHPTCGALCELWSPRTPKFFHHRVPRPGAVSLTLTCLHLCSLKA